MKFEDLQKSWKEQRIAAPATSRQHLQGLATKWEAQQRSVFRSNILVTTGFVSVLCVFLWTYLRFHAGRSLFFSGSLLIMATLLLVYLWVIWKGWNAAKMDMSIPAGDYIGRYINTLLWRRKTITHYSWVYVILLWGGLMAYLFDVTREGSLLFKAIAFGTTTAYTFGVAIISRVTKSRKQIAEIDGLIAGLNALRNGLDSSD